MSFSKPTKILLLGGNIWYFAEGMLGPLFAVFADRIGGDILDITWAWAIYLIFAGLLYVVVGKITDRYDNAEKIMVAGYILNTICTFSFIIVSAPWHLFLVQAGLGISAALASPTWNALYAKHGDDNQRGFQWGVAGGVAQIITGIAVITGGYIVNFGSFTTLFIVMGTIQTIATIYQAQILKNSPK